MLGGRYMNIWQKVGYIPTRDKPWGSWLSTENRQSPPPTTVPPFCLQSTSIVYLWTWVFLSTPYHTQNTYIGMRRVYISFPAFLSLAFQLLGIYDINNLKNKTKTFCPFSWLLQSDTSQQTVLQKINKIGDLKFRNSQEATHPLRSNTKFRTQASLRNAGAWE